MARIELSFDAWKEGRVTPATVEVPTAILDVKESKELRATLRGHTGFVMSVAFAPDGKTLASCTGKSEVKLWDVESAKERRTLKQPGTSFSLAFLAEGRTLGVPWFEIVGKDGKALTGSYKAADVKGYRGGIQLWDVATGEKRGTLQRQSPRGVAALALSRDGKILAAREVWRASDGKDSKSGVALWDVAAGKILHEFELESGAMAFAPDGKTLALSTAKGVELRDVASGRKRGTLGEEKSLFALAFAPDGKTLAGCDLQRIVHLWDVERGAEKAQLQQGGSPTSACLALAFAPDGKTLAVGVGPRSVREFEAGEIVLWDVDAAKKRLTLRGHVGNIWSLAFSADGALLASGGMDKTVKLWNIASRSASKR